MADKKEIVQINNAYVMWASTDQPNKKSGKFQIDLCQLTAADVKALAAIGVKCRTKDTEPEKGHFITVKSKTGFKLLDEDGEALASDVRISNGSMMKALVNAYSWSGSFGSGISPGLIKGKLTKLVEYIGDTGFDDDDSDVKAAKVSMADMDDDIPF